jgi:putative DNA primase/helicase
VATDHLEEIKEARPTIPVTLNDREGDNWFPLLAIAGQIGEDWKTEAEAAAQTLSGFDDAETVSTQVLVALKGIYDQFKDEDFLPTSKIVEELNQERDCPWADWKNGMTDAKLGQILGQFGIKSKRPTIEIEEASTKGSTIVKKKVSGYYREHLEPVFERYVYTAPPSVTPEK